MLDLLFHGASVIDGTGSPAQQIDVGVKDGRITLDTAGKVAKETVDATGLTLCPGFIDPHSHGDMSIGMDFGAVCKLSQGVTTEVGGQCGNTPFPVDPRFWTTLRGTLASASFKQLPAEHFYTFNDYADYSNSCDLPLNMFTMVGHNTLRISVMGVEDREPTSDELELMKERLKEAMEQGAMGMSSGLIYTPGVFCKTDELVELCKVMKPYGGIYATHMRDEARNVVESVREAIYVAEMAGVPLSISHHKICGSAFWGKSAETLRLVDEAVKRGVKIIVDQYPYEACMTSLKICIPPWYFSDGTPALLEKLADPQWRKKIAAEMNDPDSPYDNFYLNSNGFSGVFISSIPNVPEAEGMMVSEYAEKIGKDPMDTYFDLLLASGCAGRGVYFSMSLEEVEKIYAYPLTVVGSDGLCAAMVEKGHPRAWGTFIRPLREFSQEKGIVPFEKAIQKQTSMSADFWGLKDRGRIAEGYYADLVLLDRSKLYDRASYQDSNQKADGVEAVYVLGQCVYRDKELTGNYPGRLLRRGE